MWHPNQVVEFVYDGTYWLMVNPGPATTSYEGVVKLSSATNSTSEELAATPKAVKTTYDLAQMAENDAIDAYDLASSKSSVTIVDWEED